MRRFVGFAAPCLITLAALLAPGAAGAQFDAAPLLAGRWTAQTIDRFGARRACRIDLSTAGSIFGGMMASAGTCTGGLAMVARWRAERGGITLSDMTGAALGRLWQRPEGLAGATSAGERLWLTRGGDGFGAGAPSLPGGRRPCQLYYGASERCAPAADIDAPRLAPGQSVTVRVVHPAHLRTAPSLAAPSLGIVPLNTCLAAEACAAAPGGGEWCRMRQAGRTGYMLKAFERDGRRMILFSNRCSAS
ncbi:hypothetical protein BN1110_02406 [bacterium YEK0313]|nr:hypothetical protein BN1110_02406 [bacterium YEK0313]